MMRLMRVLFMIDFAGGFKNLVNEKKEGKLLPALQTNGASPMSFNSSTSAGLPKYLQHIETTSTAYLSYCFIFGLYILNQSIGKS